MKTRHLAVPLVSILLAACAAQPTNTANTGSAGSVGNTGSAGSAASTGSSRAAGVTPAASPFGPTRLVKSKDGRFDGEVIGTPGARFSKLQIGMTMPEVTGLIGAPDNMKQHETGKRWIPFYFGNDVQRIQVFYKGEGCLTYTGGNAFGGGGNELIRITGTPRSDCME